MGKIIVLGNDVANQIAAGEVVERPASVVKELIENALDAQASSVEVRIKGAGLDHIMVQDNGIGMDADDLVLATKRYATSKLRSANDLFLIKSFGFRGEALPSIASISEMTIISRPPDQDYGSKAFLKAGEVVEVSRASAPVGTRFLVRDLFFNVPARLKFVKTKRAETVAIERLIRAYSFMFPEISWQLISDDKLIFSAPKSELRAVALLGRETQNHSFPFDLATDFLRLTGTLVAPMITRTDTRGIYVFVNNRLVNDRKLVQAIKASFRTLLEVGRNPLVALKIEIAPEEVDVNAHPQKTELRFVDERRVMSHIIRLLSDFLSSTPWLSAQARNHQEKIPAPSPLISRVPMPMDIILPNIPMPLSFTKSSALSLMPSKKFSDLRVIGQVSATYLLLESNEGLVLVDQHAAHERVTFEKIRHKIDRTLASAPLLIPLTIELSTEDMALLLDHLDELYRLGIEAEPFSDNHVVIRALPDFIKEENARALFRDVLSELSDIGRSDSLDTLYDGVCSTIACHGSLRAGQRLNNEEIKALLLELDSIEFNAHCPHGRPVVKSFAEDEMKKWFHRT